MRLMAAMAEPWASFSACVVSWSLGRVVKKEASQQDSQVRVERERWWGRCAREEKERGDRLGDEEPDSGEVECRLPGRAE